MWSDCRFGIFPRCIIYFDDFLSKFQLWRPNIKRARPAQRVGSRDWFFRIFLRWFLSPKFGVITGNHEIWWNLWFFWLKLMKFVDFGTPPRCKNSLGISISDLQKTPDLRELDIQVTRKAVSCRVIRRRGTFGGAFDDIFLVLLACLGGFFWYQVWSDYIFGIFTLCIIYFDNFLSKFQLWRPNIKREKLSQRVGPRDWFFRIFLRWFLWPKFGVITGNHKFDEIRGFID